MNAGERLLRRLAALALLATAAAIALMAVRAGYAISFALPLQLVTSGEEHAPLYALWREIHMGATYLDPHRIPFAPTYYNWLFYATYGGIVGGAQSLFGFADAWIPTAARLVTLAFALLGTWAGWRAFPMLVPPDVAAAWPVRALAFAFAATVFLGPFAGFWAMTLHPELPAAALLALSVLRFCRLYPERPVRAVVEFALLSYAAWGFKQLYVYGPGGVGLFLLFRRDWRSLGLLVLLMSGLWGTTLAVGSPAYLKTLLFRDTYVVMSAETFLRNLLNAVAKSLPIVLGLAALAAAALRSPAVRGALKEMPPHVPVFAFGLAVAALFAVPASAKIGAGENYYFPLVWFGAGLAFAGTVAVLRRTDSRVCAVAVGVGWVGSLAVAMAVLGGVFGVLSTRYMYPSFMERKACAEALPQPAFINSKYGMLPWMHRGREHYVLSYEYVYDRAAGRDFERGGVGGLIAAGHFAALVIEPDKTEFDGAALGDRYRRTGRQCAGADIWMRDGLPP